MAAAEIILADQAQAAQVFNEALREACAELDQKKATGAQPLKEIVRAQEPNYLPAQLLYAFAIENAVKGLCVARDPSLAENEKLPKFLKQHELNTLIAETGVQMSDAELRFLDKVTHVIKWAGRYPVAENISQHKEGIHPIHSPDRILGSSEDANEKLREIFNHMIK
jgi:hypothetical protein